LLAPAGMAALVAVHGGGAVLRAATRSDVRRRNHLNEQAAVKNIIRRCLGRRKKGGVWRDHQMRQPRFRRKRRGGVTCTPRRCRASSCVRRAPAARIARSRRRGGAGAAHAARLSRRTTRAAAAAAARRCGASSTPRRALQTALLWAIF